MTPLKRLTRATKKPAHKPSANERDAAAQFWPTHVGHSGGNGAQNYSDTLRRIRRAAERGDPKAQYGLALAYAEGLGVPQDDVKAYMWYDVAAANWGSGTLRDLAVEKRDRIVKRMTPAQIARAQRLALKRKAKAR